MNRSELVAIVASSGGFRKSDAEKAVDSLLTAITDALKRGDELRLPGFGTFTVATRAAGQARNPRTGEPVMVAASRQPKFKAGKALKDALNNRPGERRVAAGMSMRHATDAAAASKV
jgi:DNA-binding protein HU-beta